jgi:hypothetical protein
MGIYPSGVWSTNCARSWSVIQIRQGAPEGELLAGNEAVIEPSMHGRRGESKDLRSSVDGNNLPVVLRLLALRLLRGYPPMRAQSAHVTCGEAHTRCGGLTLAIEDAGDRGVTVEPARVDEDVSVVELGKVEG